jgi:hypothetical protein
LILTDEGENSLKITKQELLDDREAARTEKIFNLGMHDHVQLSGLRSTVGRHRRTNRQANRHTPDATAGTYPRRRARREAEPPFGDVTMSVHKLSADSGYDYLTRQVAACDWLSA